MGTLFDYIEWRGDLSFEADPINEVDNLIFSLISYIDFDGIVTSKHSADPVSLQAAANAFFAKNPDLRKVSIGLIIPKEIVRLFYALRDCRRFRGVRLKAYTNLIDLKKEMQFSALTYVLPTGETVVAYRGTDDTIVGWKENFNMSFMDVIPSQKAAALYLDMAAKYSEGPIYVTGHSKGGNLSVYAGTYCGEAAKARVVRVWSNDGPGFANGLPESDAYLDMKPRIRTLIPQSSVVGMLLEHDKSYTVVKSRQAGVLQHNGLTWEVEGNHFVHMKDVSGECVRTDKTLQEWIRGMTPEQREQFSESIYQILSADNALTLTQLMSPKNRWLRESLKLDPEVRKTLHRTIRELIGINTKNLFSLGEGKNESRKNPS